MATVVIQINQAGFVVNSDFWIWIDMIETYNPGKPALTIEYFRL